MQVARWGNSLAVRIPVGLARELGLKEGDEIDLHVAEPGHLVVITERQQREAALERLRSFRGSLPLDYKFDREEANAR